MTKELATRPLVCIVWKDATTNATGEYDERELLAMHKPSVYHSFGLLLLDDAEGVTIFSEHCPEDSSWRGRTFIPRGMIVEVLDLGVPKRPRPKRPRPMPPVVAE